MTTDISPEAVDALAFEIDVACDKTPNDIKDQHHIYATVADGRLMSNTLRALSAALAASQAEVKALRVCDGMMAETLEWYADEVMTYSATQQKEPRSAAHADAGKRARAVLQVRAALQVQS